VDDDVAEFARDVKTVADIAERMAWLQCCGWFDGIIGPRE
jgi:hypothetical protein